MGIQSLTASATEPIAAERVRVSGGCHPKFSNARHSSTVADNEPNTIEADWGHLD